MPPSPHLLLPTLLLLLLLLLPPIPAATVTPLNRRRGSGSGSGSGAGGRPSFGRPAGGRPTRPATGGAVVGSGSDDDDACFPANATIHVQHLGPIPMQHLAVGHRVLTAHNKFSHVFLFTHRVPRSAFPFVELRTTHGVLRVSKGHYVYADGELITAGLVVEGAWLERGDGSRARVVAVKRVYAVGLYNPQTVAGELVVDGFRTSCYTSSVEPRVANSLLAPLRAVYGVLGWDVTGESLHFGVPKLWRGGLLAGPQSLPL